MRSLTSEALAKINQRLGLEPRIVVEIEWTPGGVVAYDPLEVGGLDSIIDLQSSATNELSVTLDDSSGNIKAIFDTCDPHFCPVRVYQAFVGVSDRILLVAGELATPCQWSEADRTFSFSVLTELEDKEFGFSAEEGQFPFVPRELVGKPWPVVFGTVLDCPALQVNKAVSGSTLCGLGILSGADLHNQVSIGNTDSGLNVSLAMMSQQASALGIAAQRWQPVDSGKASELREQLNAINAQMSQAVGSQAQQLNCATSQRSNKIAAAQESGVGCNPVRILGGEDFPQHVPIKLNINGGLFVGIMRNDEFTISTREHPDNDAKAQAAFSSIEASQCKTPTTSQFFDISIATPSGDVRRTGFIICEQSQLSRPSAPQVAQHFWAEAGSRVVLHGDEPITYIASITPGTVLAVKAFKTLDGVRKLINVPNDLWRIETKVYGSITAVQVVTKQPLSSIIGQGWDDDLFITFESSIGPNTVDILEYILERFSDLTPDTSSFDYVRDKVSPFPMNFVVLERRNTLELIKDIAFQARCALWVSNGVVYLKYLPEESTSAQTITVSDIEAGSAQVTYTETEEVCTKIEATWRLSWAGEPDKIILRNNIAKHGVRAQTIDFTCFNNPDIVLKAATFWLIRKSNTWKKLRFRGFLNLLKLEPFDTVTLNLPPWVAQGSVKAIVEKASYDSASNSIDFELLVPVRDGEMAKYPFFWPSALPLTTTYQSNSLDNGVTGALPIGYIDSVGQGGTVWVGGPNVVFRSRSDRGDRTPTDVGFQVQPIVTPSVYAEVTASANPNPDLTLNYIDQLPQLAKVSLPSSPLVIDIRKTKIIDSSKRGKPSATLDSLIRQVTKDGLVVKSNFTVGNGTNKGAFATKFDGKFGAATAFLKGGGIGKREETWNALIRRINNLAANPSAGCDPLPPLAEVGPNHIWKKSDIRAAQDKLKAICATNSFPTIPDKWEQSIVDRIDTAINNGWCGCAPAGECVGLSHSFFEHFYPLGSPIKFEIIPTGDAPSEQTIPLYSSVTESPTYNGLAWTIEEAIGNESAPEEPWQPIGTYRPVILDPSFGLINCSGKPVFLGGSPANPYRVLAPVCFYSNTMQQETCEANYGEKYMHHRAKVYTLVYFG